MPARLGADARHPESPERLPAHQCARDSVVDVKVADGERLPHAPDRRRAPGEEGQEAVVAIRPA